MESLLDSLEKKWNFQSLAATFEGKEQDFNLKTYRIEIRDTPHLFQFAFNYIEGRNLLEFLNTHSKTSYYCLRIIFFSALFIALFSLINGCSSHKKPTPHSETFGYKKTGVASYYADKYHSRKTASGEIFDNNLMTAAHKTLPFGTKVVVKNLRNGKSVKVKINDRGPFKRKRIIDLSRAAFSKIENLNKGLAKVEITVVE